MLHRGTRILIGVLALLLMTAPIVGAEEAKKSSGTVMEVNAEAGEFTVKDYNGKTYVIKEAGVIVTDLKTGDEVEYDLEEAGPANVKKK